MSILLYKPDQVLQTFLNVPGVYLYDPNNEIGIFDKIVFGKYWHLSSMLSILDKDFLSAQQNLNFEEEAEFLMTPELANLLQLPNSLVVFYNEYETADFITKVDLLQEFINQFFNLPPGKILFSTSDYWNHQTLFNNLVYSYDWVNLREKRNFNRKNMVNFHGKKKYRMLSLNRRSNWERYRYCAYLNENFPETTQFTFLSIGMQPIDNKHLTVGQMETFNKILPRQIDGYDPQWDSLEGLLETIGQSYFLVIFETNAEDIKSAVQQVSEKSYKGIKTGKPFIIFTTKGGILDHLKSLGFKTFAPFISEEYDNPLLSYNDRYNHLLEETKRLCTMPESELMELYNQLEGITIHNLENLQSRDNIPNIFNAIME
ncbi:MAG: hypothetical protein IPL23_20435 [Saprospiraceae bacterium]|nr:hypothetical protein [Saprospiraceae bacterium]